MSELHFFQLDRQNKKIAELEETVRKLESLKTIAESQNVELLKKLKEAERAHRTNNRKSFPKPNTSIDEVKDSPNVSFFQFFLVYILKKVKLEILSVCAFV